MKFLIGLASVVLCIGVLALGGYLTYQQSDVGGMVEKITAIANETPIFPDQGGNDETPDVPGDEMGGNEENPGSPTPEDPDQGGDVVDPDQGGDVVDPDQGGDVIVPNPDEGGTPEPDPDVPGENTPVDPNPDQGGNDNPNPNPDQGGNDDPNFNPGEEPDTPPANDSLSSEDAQEALGNLYDNSDPEFNDMNREFFVGMIEGFLGGNNNNTEPEPPVEDGDEPDFDESFDDDFGGEFNPDEFEPEDEEEPEEDAVQNEVNDLIIDVAGTYFDNLQAGIQQNQQDNAGATEEEQQAARDEFIQQESEAFAGLINIATKPEETTEEQLVQSVDAVLNSSVCLDTVAQSVEKNESLSTTVQDATVNMNEETKSEIETKINEALEANPEKEQQYKDLANLFGITLGAGTTPEIPEGFNPDDYPFGNN